MLTGGELRVEGSAGAKAWRQEVSGETKSGTVRAQSRWLKDGLLFGLYGMLESTV